MVNYKLEGVFTILEYQETRRWAMECRIESLAAAIISSSRDNEAPLAAMRRLTTDHLMRSDRRLNLAIRKRVMT